jgi:hypothetical protein
MAANWILHDGIGESSMLVLKPLHKAKEMTINAREQRSARLLPG